VPSVPLPVDELVTILTRTPVDLAAMAKGVSPAQLRARPQDDEWSANEVLAHLRSCADVWGDGIATILAEPTPTIRAVNPRTWIKTTDYPDLDFGPSLRSFAKQRTALLAVLTDLPPAGWSRRARITGVGAPQEWTVLTYASRLARHERAHVAQVATIIKRVRAAD
jgi:hypothetical protein